MRKRRLKLLVLGCLAPLVFLAVFLVIERVRGCLALNRYKQLMVQQGEKLSPQDFGPGDAGGKDSARELWSTVAQLKPGNVLPKTYPPRMKITDSGSAIVGFRQDDWINEPVTNGWEQLAADLRTNETTLEKILILIQKPLINNDLDYSQGPLAKLSHLARAKQLTAWLGSRSTLALHSSRSREGLSALCGEIRLPHTLETDNILISELVRVAIAGVARLDVWEALQANDWKEQDLARIQNAWAQNTFATNFLPTLQEELFSSTVTCNLLRKSNDETYSIFYIMQDYGEETDRPKWEQFIRSLPGGIPISIFFKKQIYCRLWRFAWVDQFELHYMRQTREFLDLCQIAVAQKSLTVIRERLEAFLQRGTHVDFYDQLRFPDFDSPLALSKSLNRVMKAETERSIVLCALGVKRYRLRSGNNPSSLEMLVPDFLAAVPADYMDGRPVKFHLKSDGAVVLYSSGLDGKDDLGDTGLMSGQTNLHDLWARKDFVWPLPATEKEIEDYKKVVSASH
jgi:hypothetical protein